MKMTIGQLSEHDDETFYILKDGVREYISVSHAFGDVYKIQFYNVLSKLIMIFHVYKDTSLEVQA